MLPRSFYTRHDVVEIARDLLGKVLVTRMNNLVTTAIITETEAYAGIADRASHAFGGRRTVRTEIMYRIGGTAYIYLCYGVHSLFNVVTNKRDIPHAVLIRGIKPLEGIEIMEKRYRKKILKNDVFHGPGKVTTLMGIHYSYTGLDLTIIPRREQKPGIWIEESLRPPLPSTVLTSSRVGVNYAGEDASLPYRFILKFNSEYL